MAQNQHCILIVEDTWNDLVLMNTVLDELGLKGQVVAVHTARAALDFLSGVERGRNPEPIVIFVDLGLPDMPGQALISDLRSRSSFRSTPIVIFSDLPVNKSEELARDLEVQSCHQKPARFETFQQSFSDLILPWAERLREMRSTQSGHSGPAKSSTAGASE